MTRAVSPLVVTAVLVLGLAISCCDGRGAPPPLVETLEAPPVPATGTLEPPTEEASPPPLPSEEIALAGPADANCPADESLTILLDGDRVVDSRFATGGDQPSAVLAITEADGTLGILVEDAGTHAPSLERNLDTWLDRLGRERLAGAHRAVLVSHAHTVGRMLLPANKVPKPVESPRVYDALFQRFGTIGIQGPNLAQICQTARRDTTWDVSAFCDRELTTLEPGVSALRWEDASASSRVHVLTYAIAPPEVDEIPFQPLESVLVVSARSGYLVYSLCSHIPEAARHGSEPPFHAAYLVREAMDQGLLAREPIHTIVTGTCGVNRTFHHHGGDGGEARFDSAEFVRRATAMKTDLGVERLYLTHCGLYRTNREALQPFHEVFGDAVEMAYPGACIPLAP